MVTEKPDATLSREKILTAALRTWSRDYFTKTSLASIAKALSVTKPAIYRYFQNKDDLLSSIDDIFVQSYAEQVLEPLEERFLDGSQLSSADRQGRPWAGSSPTSAPTSLPTLSQLTAAFIRQVGTFFRNNPELYAFLVGSVFQRAIEYRDAFKSLTLRQNRLFDNATEPVSTDAAHKAQIIRFIVGFAVFWTTQCFRKPLPPSHRARKFDPSQAFLSPETIETAIEQAVSMATGGFLTGFDPADVSYDTVEQVAWFHKEELPEPDRLLAAIEAVVSEVGFENASVERIADRVGMTKSSLYFHFKNREDMLSRMVLREQEGFIRIARARLGALNNPVDRLYALMVMIAGYNYHNPSQLTVLNWLRYNQVQVQIPKQHIVSALKMFRFLPAMVKEGRLAGDPEDPYPMLAFLNFVVQQELMSGPITSLTPDVHRSRIRSLFRLFAFGIDRIQQEKQEL